MQGMRTATVLDRQSIFDIAIQHCGAAEVAYDIAVINGISITDELTVGQVLELPEPINKDIVKYYKDKNLTPATAYKNLTAMA